MRTVRASLWGAAKLGIEADKTNADRVPNRGTLLHKSTRSSQKRFRCLHLHCTNPLRREMDNLRSEIDVVAVEQRRIARRGHITTSNCSVRGPLLCQRVTGDQHRIVLVPCRSHFLVGIAEDVVLANVVGGHVLGMTVFKHDRKAVAAVVRAAG